MPDYRKGKIYTLIDVKSNTILYVGSTCQTLNRRYAGHVVDMKRRGHLKIYKKIAKLKSGFAIKLYKLYPCNTRNKLRKEEGRIVSKLLKKGIKLYNMVLPGRTTKQWEKTETGKLVHKRYKQSDAGKASIKRYKQSDVGKAAAKRYKQSDAGKATAKKYRQKIIKCECGKYITQGNRYQHLKSKKHIELCRK